MNLSYEILEIKDLINGLDVIDGITQGDLKWFHKQWAKEGKDLVSPIEDIVRDMQKKFLEVKEKKMPTK